MTNNTPTAQTTRQRSTGSQIQRLLHKLMRGLGHRLQLTERTLKLVWKATGRWTMIWLLLLLVQGIIPAALVYLARILVNNLGVALQSNGAVVDYQGLLLPAVGMGLLLLCSSALNSAINWIHVLQADLVRDHLAVLIHQQSATVDLAFYETPAFHDHLQRARADALYLPLDLLESMGEVAVNCITLIAMSALLLPYGWWLPAALGLSTAPAFIIILRNHGLLHKWWESVTERERWTKYYDTMLTLEETAAEVRLFDLGPQFIKAYQALRRELRSEYINLSKRQNIAQFVASTASFAVTAVVAMIIFWRAINGWYALGDLALLYQAFQQGQSLLHTLFDNVGRVYRHLLFLENLFAFLDLQPQVVDPPLPAPVPQPLQEGIHFRNVTFHYPGSDRAALTNFNLTLPAGQTVAIVGENGAGKSTLVKLLCRFYDPQEGTIDFDGVDLRQMETRALRDALSVMFQKPVPYHASAADNIAVGVGLKQIDPGAIEAAARAAGIDETLSSLPKGYETLLGKWFVDGTGLSGGEWQRVALARAFLRRTEIILLDEPTSAMDSWAEAEWLDRFRTLVQGRTAVVITHRFTTAMRADLILVMRQGEIVEAGTHQSLLAANGFYAQSWQRQIAEVTESSRQPSIKRTTPTQCIGHPLVPT